MIIEMLEKQKTQANFGNAGAIDNLIRSALAKAASRPLIRDKIKLEISDIEKEKDILRELIARHGIRPQSISGNFI